jgi:hypothetical protein
MLFSYSCQLMFQGKSMHLLAGFWVAQECKFLRQSLCAAANASTPIASLNWLPCLHASSIMHVLRSYLKTCCSCCCCCCCCVLPAGQLAVGELLVQSMYAAQPDISSCSQEQQLQLLLLADRYGVPKVLAAVSASFAGIAAADFEWQTVMALYSLPPGCCDLDACKSLCAVAGDKLQQELGDLELTWEDAGKQQLLLGLPLQALLQLLRDDRTRVASENTVFYSIHRWWKRQQALVASSGAPAPAEDDMRALLQLVRMQVRVKAYSATCCIHTMSAGVLLSYGIQFSKLWG